MKFDIQTVLLLIGFVRTDADKVKAIIAKIEAAEDAASKAVPPLHGAKRDIAIARAIAIDVLDLADLAVDQAASQGLAV